MYVLCGTGVRRKNYIDKLLNLDLLYLGKAEKTFHGVGMDKHHIGSDVRSYKNVKSLKISSTKSQLSKSSRILSHASCLSSGISYFQTTSVLTIRSEQTVTLSASL